MKEIILTRNKVARVDDVDYEELNQYAWSAMPNHYTWYAQRITSRVPGPRKIILMHRQILRALSKIEVDHRDGNGLNNCRHNLRLATHQENLRNQTRKRKNTSSRFKGVYWRKDIQKWHAQIGDGTRTIRGNPHRINLGCFDNEEDAAHAYDDAAHRLFGAFGTVNFPRDFALDTQIPQSILHP